MWLCCFKSLWNVIGGFFALPCSTILWSFSLNKSLCFEILMDSCTNLEMGFDFVSCIWKSFVSL